MEFSDFDFCQEYNNIKEKQARKSLCAKLNDGCYTLFWISPLGSFIDERKHNNAKHLLNVAIHMNNKNN